MNANTEGKFVTLSRLHRITASTAPDSQRFLQLLPASFAGLAPSDLIPSPTPSKTTIRIPRESAVYACLIRVIALSPRHDPTRVQALSDLAMLTMYHLYGMDGYNEEEDDLDADEDPAVQDALARVREWTWNRAWRVGEEWIGDLLYGYVEGTYRDAYMPWSD